MSGTALRYQSLKSRGDSKFANFVFGSLKGFQESGQKETTGLEGLRASDTPPSSPEATVPEAAAAAAATARIPAWLRLLLSSSSISSQTGKTLFKFSAGLGLCAKLGLENRTPSPSPHLPSLKKSHKHRFLLGLCLEASGAVENRFRIWAGVGEDQWKTGCAANRSVSGPGKS